MPDTEIKNETANLINSFIQELRILNRSENTIIAYLFVLQTLFRDIGKNITEITRDDLFYWFEKYRIGKEPRTINQRLALVKIFFDYCCLDLNIIEDNPVYYKWRAKQPKTLPRHLSFAERTKVVLLMEELKLRDRAMLHSFFDTGYRVSELVSITKDDISFENRTITLKTKGKKMRVAFIKGKTVIVLKMLVDSIPAEEENVFLNKFGNRISSRSVCRILNKIGKDLGFVRSFSPHVCRHTFATELMENGADLEFVRELMDHASINTTREYAKSSSRLRLAKYDQYKRW